MKRILLAAMAVILVFALCAWSGSGQTGVSSGTAQASAQPPEGADVLTQGVYYYELAELSGDYGDGLSPREGAVLTNELLLSYGLYIDNGSIPAGQCIYISFDELAVLDSAMGRECYLYSVGLGTYEGGLMGDDYQVVYRVSVDYSGKQRASIYDDFSSEYTGDGRGDMIVPDPGGSGWCDIIESDPGDGLPYWNGLDFGPNLSYGEEYEIPGDPGEYLNAAEGAKLTFDAMKANGSIPEYSDGLQYTMTLIDLKDIEGEECYVYRLDVDEPSGMIGAAYAYAYQSGNIYMQGQGGQWVISDSNVPEWWGEYKSEDAFCSVAISNYRGTSFNFEIYFLRNGHLLYDGVAAVDPDNSFIAEYGEFSFALSDDFNVINIFVLESPEWSHLSGSYERIEVNEIAGSHEYSPRLDARIEGFVLESGNQYILDDAVMAYTDTLAGGGDVQAQVKDYLSLQDREVSEWLTLDIDEALSEQVGYTVWVAEYYIGYEEDTNLCVDAVVQTGEWDGLEHTLILHTVRDADLDMNSDIDYGARIRELFETIKVVTV